MTAARDYDCAAASARSKHKSRYQTGPSKLSRQVSTTLGIYSLLWLNDGHLIFRVLPERAFCSSSSGDLGLGYLVSDYREKLSSISKLTKGSWLPANGLSSSRQWA